MTYNPDKASEIKMPKPGAHIDAEVIEINDGKRKDFQSKQYIEEYQLDGDDSCIEVVCQGDYKGTLITVKQAMPYTEGKEGMSYHPKSNMGRYKAWYGVLPKKGDTVRLEANADSYWRLKY